MHKVSCPLCGLTRVPGALKRHAGTRPCRAQQIANRMREDHGLVPAFSLDSAKLLHKAGLPYLRIPADSKSAYRNETAYGYRDWPKPIPEPDTRGPLYDGLGDMIFVYAWIHESCGGFLKRESFLQTVAALRDMANQNTEARTAVLAVHRLSGSRTAWELLWDGC